ncbi:putative uncharacterized protein DDB_G0290521 [Physella acuta]|uniref:putative uncharacterized protein DDB_G0290521 n=1 Tax=Physella acuta TaxID=109671 RepID=UPI0027DCEAB6|nr:putative uncharacterized protein DDB_G0290521 [Physella acuta]
MDLCRYHSVLKQQTFRVAIAEGKAEQGYQLRGVKGVPPAAQAPSSSNSPTKDAAKDPETTPKKQPSAQEPAPPAQQAPTPSSQQANTTKNATKPSTRETTTPPKETTSNPNNLSPDLDMDTTTVSKRKKEESPTEKQKQSKQDRQQKRDKSFIAPEESTDPAKKKAKVETDSKVDLKKLKQKLGKISKKA